MTDILTPQRRGFPLPFVLGILLMALACSLLIVHIQNFSLKKNQALTIGSQISQLRSKVLLMRATLESEKAYGADILTSQEEQASAYILPAQPDTARTVHVVQELVTALDADHHQFALDRLTFASAPQKLDGHTELGATAVLHGNLADVSHFLSVIEQSGKLTVSDVLGPTLRTQLLSKIESGSPDSLTAAAQFLLIDILRYSTNADDEEKKLFRDMSLALASDIHASLIQAGLGDIRTTLAPIASQLKSNQAWPLPLMRTVSVSEKDGEWTIGLAVITR